MDSYQSLVTTTYVAFSEALDAPKKVTFGVEQVMSEMYEVEWQRRVAELHRWASADDVQVIDRVLVKLFDQTKGKPSNVLTMGYRRVQILSINRFGQLFLTKSVV